MNKLILLLLLLYPAFLFGQEAMNEFEELANGYNNQGKLTQAAEFYSKAGYAYWNKGDKSQAAKVFQKSYDLFASQGNTLGAITVGNNLGLIYLDEEKYNNAYTAFSNVLSFARKTKNTTETFNALLNAGSVAYELSSFKDAISKAQEALSIAKEQNNLRYIAKCYSLMAESYEKMGESSNAFKYFELYSAIDQKIKKLEMENVKQMSAEEVNRAEETKRMAEIELKIKKGELKLTQDSLSVTAQIAHEREMQIELRNEQLKKKELQLKYERKVRQNLVMGISITVFFLMILGLLLNQKFRDNKKLKKQKEEITEQRNRLDIQNKKITDSIQYGLRIQQAMLPETEALQKTFETLILYKPKDIVSGDFYWYHEIKEKETIYHFIAVADCTGHGVPGAFMSMIGHRLLTEIIIEKKITSPSQILEKLNISIRKELGRDQKKLMDGMDIALCRIGKKNGDSEELVFSGAKRSMIIQKKDEEEIRFLEGDRKDIGGFLCDEDKAFTEKTVTLSTGDTLFLYTDGIIDQPDPHRNRFGTPQFISILKKYRSEPLDKLQIAMEHSFETHRMSEEQRDDVTVIGLRLC